MAVSANMMKSLLNDVKNLKKKTSYDVLIKKLEERKVNLSSKQEDKLFDAFEKRQNGLETRDVGTYNRTYNGSKRKKKYRKYDLKKDRQESALREETRKKKLAMITSNKKHIPSSIDWGYDAWDVK